MNPNFETHSLRDGYRLAANWIEKDLKEKQELYLVCIDFGDKQTAAHESKVTGEIRSKLQELLKSKDDMFEEMMHMKNFSVELLIKIKTRMDRQWEEISGIGDRVC